MTETISGPNLLKLVNDSDAAIKQALRSAGEEDGLAAEKLKSVGMANAEDRLFVESEFSKLDANHPLQKLTMDARLSLISEGMAGYPLIAKKATEKLLEGSPVSTFTPSWAASVVRENKRQAAERRKRSRPPVMAAGQILGVQESEIDQLKAALAKKEAELQIALQTIEDLTNA